MNRHTFFEIRKKIEIHEHFFLLTNILWNARTFFQLMCFFTNIFGKFHEHFSNSWIFIFANTIHEYFLTTQIFFYFPNILFKILNNFLIHKYFLNTLTFSDFLNICFFKNKKIFNMRTFFWSSIHFIISWIFFLQNSQSFEIPNHLKKKKKNILWFRFLAF